MRRNLNLEQFGQLPMFVSAQDIHDNYYHGDAGGVLGYKVGGPFSQKRLDALYERKLGESQEDYRAKPEEYDKGVRTPIDLSTSALDMPMIWNGHHRLASAYHRNPNELLPVIHTSRPYEWDESAERSEHYGRVPAIKEQRRTAADAFMKLRALHE